MSENLPPLRIRESDGSPNVIPVYEIILSNNLAVINNGGGKVTLTAADSLATTIYASTGNRYVTVTASADLPNEEVLTQSTGILVTSGGAGGNILVSVSPLVVRTDRTIDTTYPVIGGGNFSADRTFTIDTAFLVSTARTINTTLPLSGGGTLAADRTFTIVNANATTTGAISNTDWAAFNAKASTATTISAGAGLSGGGDLSANRTLALVTPVHVASGGIGVGTLTNRGILYGQSNAPILALAALESGQLIVGSAGTAAPYIFGPGSDGQMLTARSGAAGGFIFVATAAPIVQSNLAQVWFSTTNSGSTILNSYNLVSFSRQGVGLYLATFTNAFSNTSYVASWNSQRASNQAPLICCTSMKAVGSCGIITFADNNSLQDANVLDGIIFGT